MTKRSAFPPGQPSRPGKQFSPLTSRLLPFALALIFSPGARAATLPPPQALRCEYAVNPLALDTAQPRFFWQLPEGERGRRQTAFQILVASSEDKLQRDQGDVWTSGKVASERSVFVPYQGKPLASRQQCWWKVRYWNEKHKASPWSEPAFFGTGLLAPEDWEGQWIASDLELKDYQKTLRALPDFGMEPESEIWSRATQIREMTKDVKDAPAVWLRKEFDAAPVRRATAYVSGLGLFELYVNGRRIGDRCLDPAYTDYQKRVFYQALDVTAALKSGRNAVGVILGNGWFNLVIPHVLRYYAADYIAPPQLRLELDLEMADGSHQRVVTDPGWKFTCDGPIVFNSVLSGETYDARKEMPGWDCAGFDDRSWKPAQLAPAPDGKLIAQMLPPVRKTQSLPAVSVAKQGDGWRFDLGVETTGWAKLQLHGNAGQEITIKYPGAGGHTLGRYQTCQYLCKGTGTETFAPRFCYNGYRYVEVTGLAYEPKASDLTGELVCSDLASAGAFACSDERLNKLQEILLRTIRNYITHIPNDPTREKAGWTQDIECGFYETVYNFMSAPTYVKWQRDFLDIIHTNGYVPPVAPGRFDGPTINGPWWGGAIIYCPWYLYQFYGDAGILAESYPAMQRQFGYLRSIAKNNIVEWGLGDWMEVGSVRPVRTPVPLTSTCAYFYFADILSQTAALLGKAQDAAAYRALADQIRAAFNQKFFNAQTGDYATGSQTSQLLPLYFGLAPQDQRERVLQRLAERIAKDHGHLSCGFVGTPLLLSGLAELGRPDLAWTIATQTNYPSFIDAVLNRGQTAFKEDWQGGLVQMPSLQGPIGTWFYHSLAGIRNDPAGPGFQRLIIRPEIAGGLTWARAHHDCLFGRIASEWKREGSRFQLDAQIPPNTTATVYVPAGSERDVTESGVPAARAPGLKFLRLERGAAVFAAQSGTYHIASTVE
jgi:alpha-L-rhamnosidase